MQSDGCGLRDYDGKCRHFPDPFIRHPSHHCDGLMYVFHFEQKKTHISEKSQNLAEKNNGPMYVVNSEAETNIFEKSQNLPKKKKKTWNNVCCPF